MLIFEPVNMSRKDQPENSAVQKRYVAERALSAVKSLTNARTAAVFVPSASGLSLFASITVDQPSIDLANAVWKQQRESLGQGEMFYAPELNTDRRLPEAAHAIPSALAVVPAFSGSAIVAVLYVDSLEPYFCTRHDQQRLADLSTLLGESIGAQDGGNPQRTEESWAHYLEATDPVFNRQRDELLLLLNRTDWNIARVARILGVSRRTLYVRLEKYRIPREHVQKKGAGGRRTGRGTSETRTYPRFGSTFSVKPAAKTDPSEPSGDPE
jgi:hypothetical protein